ncbi:MAG: beta-N-acetylhexosaminidase [Armatimonadota bacterium]|nr:beta-N-acetylhexosaminidase [Armatimonadota bacterium]MDR7450751.1 beta-N-acetylhexosaminidase [Armatimonadota bacterium]MDR7466107.1 beta-N-acetylhexosaminidase [Armatimonadota bacterium]MDR7493856.1 beta-N-acetylhexosaminidase [Armatimonadota bacterium]MDR7498983.1 beta-N-acetylhexosaminidase [Armatimonadota bacterium]
MRSQTADLVGQHFIVDFSAPEVTPDLERLVREGRIGGVILFAKNIRSAAQVRTLTADLQRLAADAGLPPLFVTVDQEGGVVARLHEGFTVFPGAMALGATGRPEDAATAGRVTAQELRALGINVNHAPVLDVNTNPANPIIGPRAFGDDPHDVARFGIAYLRALQAAGVLATVKHFPGHGDTVLDSHLDLPTVGKDLRRLREEELYPFREAVRAGADGLLSAHIVYPALDASRPATLSPRVMRDLLRGELGFEGVVMTDSMAMKAIADRWSRGAAAVEALRAGCDLILACGSREEQWASIEAARQAVADGRLDAGMIEQSGARIAGIKARYARPSSGDGGATGTAWPLAQAIADRAVTLVRNDAGRIPLGSGRVAVIAVGDRTWEDRFPTLGEELARAGPGVVVVTSLDEVLNGTWDTVVAASLTLRAAEGVEAVRALHRHLGDRLVVVGIGSPYELLRFPEVSTYLAAYGPDPASVRAAAKALTGALTPSGRLPVALPGLHPRGWGVSARG